MKIGMKAHMKNFLQGARQVLVLYPKQDYIRPNKKGFSQDFNALRGDAAVVGKNLQRNLDKYGKVYSR